MRALPAAHPGTARWLVQHEIRLAWRINAGHRRRFQLVLAALWLVLHAGVYLVFQRWPGYPDAAPAWASLVLCGATWGVIGVMLCGTILGAVSALFDRRDLDLLLSSPLPTRTVFIARGLGIAADAARTLLFCLAPVANVGALFGFWRLLAIYLTLPALALAVTALGMSLTLGLISLLGLRRTRATVQVLGPLLGVALFLALSLYQTHDARTSLHLAAAAAHWAGPGGPLAPDSLVWLPLHALLGLPLPLLVVLIAGPAAFWLTAHLAHRRFLAGTQETLTGSTARTGKPPPAGTVSFSSGLWRSLLIKEWRLLRRDPRLISQTLTQLAYAVAPVAFALWKADASAAGLTPLLAPALVYLTSSLTGTLAWCTVSAEDLPELLRSAPISPARLRWLKALVAMVPACCLSVPALISVAIIDPLATPALALCMAGGAFSAASAHVWYPVPAKRADVTRRARGRGVAAWIMACVTLCWVLTAFCLINAPLLAPPALLAVIAGNGLVWLLGRRLGNTPPPTALSAPRDGP